MAAVPLPPLLRASGAREIATLAQIAAERAVVGLVAGLPIRADGTEGDQAAKTRRYLARVSTALDLPAAFVDERFSSALAARTLVESGRGGKRNRRRFLDSLAAAVILEDYLAARGDRGA
jgi:putative Holliday junction resolvase